MRYLTITVTMAILAMLVAVTSCLAGVPSLMSYQGRLADPSGEPLPDDIYKMQFALYDSATAGKLLWQEPVKEPMEVKVLGGVFTVLLGSIEPLPESAFEGETWLEVTVNDEVLSPRTRIVSAGYAIHALSADSAQSVPDNSITAAKIPSGQVVKSINGLKDDVTLAAGDGIELTPSGNTITLSASAAGSSGWSLTGNAGTDPASNFLGTTDDVPLILKAGGYRALKLEPAFDSYYYFAPNIVGGGSTNTLTQGRYGVFIAGGRNNTVTTNYGTIGGGLGNQAGADDGSILNGYATVGGGINNKASGQYTTIGGGSGNTASGYASSVPGGMANQATGPYSLAAGKNAIAANTGTFVWADSSASGTFTSTDSYQFLIRASHGVGINNNDPTNALSVTGNINLDHHNENDGGLEPGLKFGKTSGEGIASKRTVGGNQYGLDFFTNWGSKMSITRDGFVGIGTSVPAHKLQVETGNILAKGPGNFTGTGHEATLFLGDTNNYVRSVWGEGMRLGTWEGPDSLNLYRDRVGVGVLEPDVKLAVQGSVRVDNGSTNDGTLLTGALRLGGGSSGEGIASKRTVGGNQFGLDLYTSWAPRISITQGGNVGIGYTSPVYTLSVNGAVGASNFYESSDGRFKSNVEDVTGAVDKVSKLRGVTFDWNRDQYPERNFDDGRQIGLIAQDVEKVLPEAVSTDDNGYKSVAYTDVIPLLIEAIKEQQKTINKQQQQIDQLLDLAQSSAK